MKKLLMLAMTLVSFNASANECGLPDYSRRGPFVEISTTDLNEASRETVKELESITRQQLVIAARKMISTNETDEEIEGTWQAVEYFRNNSESSELYVIEVRHGRAKFDIIRYYPGGNEYGLIFRKGSRTPVAMISDGEIVCL